MNALIPLLKYFAVVLTDGDWMNDWITHLPLEIHDCTQQLGHWIAITLSGWK